MKRHEKHLLLWLCLLGLNACATPHPECEKADAFGHCQQWKGVEPSCAKPDFLGFCPPSQ